MPEQSCDHINSRNETKSKLPLSEQIVMFVFFFFFCFYLFENKSKSTFVFCNIRLYYILCMCFSFFFLLLCLSVSLFHSYIHTLFTFVVLCVCDFATMTGVCISCSSQFYRILREKKTLHMKETRSECTY